MFSSKDFAVINSCCICHTDHNGVETDKTANSQDRI